jgi:hypothetical protein
MKPLRHCSVAVATDLPIVSLTQKQRLSKERTQPGLPLGIGHIRTKTHDYVRTAL